jgi:MFS family permease
VADRVGAKRTLVVTLAIQALAIALYVFVDALPRFYMLGIMFGIAYGGAMPLYAIVVRDYFGDRIMGAVFGAVGLASTLGMALGPWLGGWLHDNLGSYFWLFVGSSAVGFGAVAIALTFRPPAPAPATLPEPIPAR